MALSDAILMRLLRLHPKIIDLSLGRMHRLLELVDHPENNLPPVIHVAGTNGKGSVVATLGAIIEAAGLRVHSYTSPHLVRFHERINLVDHAGRAPISETELSALLEACETANGGEPITFFEITTVAAFLAFAKYPADYLLLEVGLGGRLDATNVIDAPALSIITPVGLDHQQFLGETLREIAFEKAGILQPGTPAIISAQEDEAMRVIVEQADKLGVPLSIEGRDWQAYEQHGRLIFENQDRLLDLPLSRLVGRFQISNAGAAIAACLALDDDALRQKSIETGLQQVRWPARMQRLCSPNLDEKFSSPVEIWLDGGHNPAAGRVIADTIADLNDTCPKPVVMILGMLNTKPPEDYLSAFSGLVSLVITVTIPGEENALSADDLAIAAHDCGLQSKAAASLDDAFAKADEQNSGDMRLLIAGSLYLAGSILAIAEGVEASAVSGTTRK